MGHGDTGIRRFHDLKEYDNILWVDGYGMANTSITIARVSFYLDEDHNWVINVENVQKSIAEGQKHCDPSMMI